MRYQNENFTDIPAVHKGDAGIEGFTKHGIVHQCYCPEREYSDDELYKHLRDKMTKDINKLISHKYSQRIIDLGVPKIKQWHYVIPFYKDNRIIEHAETKRKEVIKLKMSNPNEYTHIDEDFSIIIKIAEDFRVEITRILRTTLTDEKLNIAILHTNNPDWSKCDSEKSNNIKRKVKAIMGEINFNINDYNDVVNAYINSYIKGIDILNTLRKSYTQVYEDIINLEQRYKMEVSIKTKMNTNSSINSKLFSDILNDFDVKLKSSFKYFNDASIMELKIDLISSWLADCSMEFRGSNICQ